jgi:hypothetical protein
MKYTTEMEFTELVEWAEGYILKELIAGKFHNAVWCVVDQSVRWQQEQDKREKAKIKAWESAKYNKKKS